ncbi:hypothetical protein ASC63_08365 [Leifsonia sp. Root112D2]|nr:hypothetical protein ASC63_08365 [Leifsonia sp. Root112D2]
MRGRIAASIVLTAAVVLGATGCTLISPQTTTEHYDASDGVSGSVGNIDVRNAILISDNGTSANLLVTLVNQDTKSHRVKIQSTTGGDSTNEFVTVEPGATRVVGTSDDEAVVFSNIDAKPGTLHKVYFQYGSETGLQLLVPVLTNGLPAYSTLTPTPVATP